MRRSAHGRKSGDSSASENEFSFGYFYRSIEEHVNQFAAQASGQITFSDIALRVGRLLQAASVREQLRNPELVSEVRSGAGGHAGQSDWPAEAAFHVRPHARRTLSKKALKAISKAQKERWARFHAAQDDGDRETAARLSNTPRRTGRPKKGEVRVPMSIEERRRRDREKKRAERARLKMPKTHSSNVSRAISSFWAKMSPEERSKEMLRRRQVSAAKKKARLNEAA